MLSRTTMGLVVCLGLGVGAVKAATNAAPAPARTPAAASQSADESSTDATPAAEPDDNSPYAAIIRANVFHLQDPPAVKMKEDPAILNLPKVNITGFHKREGEPLRALFATVPKDAKEAPKYFNLAEGEKQDILELKKIDPSEESVDVIIAGIPTTLTVKSNSFVQPIPKPVTPGMQPPMNRGLVVRPPMTPTPIPAPVAQPGVPAPAAYTGGVIVAGGGVTAQPAAPPAIPVGGNPPSTYGVPSARAANTGTQVNTGGENALRTIPTRIPPRPVR